MSELDPKKLKAGLIGADDAFNCRIPDETTDALDPLDDVLPKVIDREIPNDQVFARRFGREGFLYTNRGGSSRREQLTYSLHGFRTGPRDGEAEDR